MTAVETEWREIILNSSFFIVHTFLLYNHSAHTCASRKMYIKYLAAIAMKDERKSIIESLI